MKFARFALVCATVAVVAGCSEENCDCPTAPVRTIDDYVEIELTYLGSSSCDGGTLERYEVAVTPIRLSLFVQIDYLRHDSAGDEGFPRELRVYVGDVETATTRYEISSCVADGEGFPGVTVSCSETDDQLVFYPTPR